MDKKPQPQPRPRISFLDNLRTFTILLVVLYHAGLVYESSGVSAEFWLVDDPATNNLSGLLNLVLDVFVMPLLFFVSGFFAPSSLRQKGAMAFVHGKATRLLRPWFLGLLTLIPMYKAIFLASRGLPQEDWTTYFPTTNGIFGMSWLWFLPVLFLFDLSYSMVQRFVPRLSRLSLTTALLAACGIGYINSIAMDLLDLRGWTKLGWIDFQTERLLPYFLAFLVGTVCYHQGTFESGERNLVLYRLAAWFGWLPVTGYLIFLLYPWIKPGAIILHPTGDRWVLWAFYYLALLSLVYVVLEVFRRSVDGTNPLLRNLSATSYSVYLLHVIVLGLLALVLREVNLPSLVKHSLLTLGTYWLCHMLSRFYTTTRRGVGSA